MPRITRSEYLELPRHEDLLLLDDALHPRTPNPCFEFGVVVKTVLIPGWLAK